VAPHSLGSGHGLLRCPICRLDLAPAAGSLVCGNRHSFDVARDGYVNLLDGRRRSPTARGDSAEQLRHRAAFLEAGHFSPVASAIASHVAHATPVEGWRVLDAGCGTGHHLAGVAAALRTPVIGLGFDVWAEWPVQDEAADLVLSIFAPKNFAEMSRVLRPGGWLALAYPGPHHLAELVDHFGLMQQHAGKTGRYAEAMQRWVGPSTAVRLVQRLSLDRGSIRHAVLMGPNARHIAASALDVTAAMDVTIDIAMLFARKPG
jgi:23S rRNA (guanine745-N1)-methyltransferase